MCLWLTFIVVDVILINAITQPLTKSNPTKTHTRDNLLPESVIYQDLCLSLVIIRTEYISGRL